MVDTYKSEECMRERKSSQEELAVDNERKA
jgi:hypothetical protein